MGSWIAGLIIVWSGIACIVYFGHDWPVVPALLFDHKVVFLAVFFLECHGCNTRDALELANVMRLIGIGINALGG